MKKLILLTTLLLALLVPHCVKAIDLPFDLTGFYVNGNVSCNLTTYKRHHGAKFTFDPGIFVAPALGYRFNNGLRLEGEFGYRYNDVYRLKYYGASYHVNGKLETFSGMANVYYDVPFCWSMFKPYVGAGIGYAHMKHKIHYGDISSKDHDNGFAWQVIAGVAYPISENVDLALEYRFFKNESFSRIQNHDIGGSLRYYF